MPTIRNAAVLAAAGGAILVAAATWWYTRPPAPRYVTEIVSRGDVVRSIITTGSVNPVVTVQVGSYVSGTIETLSCDYNTPVKAGQLCATIDPRPYQVVVDQNAANLAVARAQLQKDEAATTNARSVYQRDLPLLERGGISRENLEAEKSTLDQSLAQLKVDEATIQQRKAMLDAANVNLGYTRIVSPVDGIVVSRSIDVGQTVAASFQTPNLFLIARDLTKMQVDTNVSESDIGAVQDGQKAFFTVESYPDTTFWGQVAQRRQAPITVQNVVTYDVVVSVDNPDLKLLPGMTANTRIVTEERQGVLQVSRQALRFAPPDAPVEGTVPTPGAGPRTGKTPAKKTAESRVWILRSGKPEPVVVTTGLSDDSRVEITGGDLKPDDQVIISMTDSGSARRAAPAATGFRL